MVCLGCRVCRRSPGSVCGSCPRPAKISERSKPKCPFSPSLSLSWKPVSLSASGDDEHIVRGRFVGLLPRSSCVAIFEISASPAGHSQSEKHAGCGLAPPGCAAGRSTSERQFTSRRRQQGRATRWPEEVGICAVYSVSRRACIRVKHASTDSAGSSDVVSGTGWTVQCSGRSHGDALFGALAGGRSLVVVSDGQPSKSPSTAHATQCATQRGLAFATASTQYGMQR